MPETAKSIGDNCKMSSPFVIWGQFFAKSIYENQFLPIMGDAKKLHVVRLRLLNMEAVVAPADLCIRNLIKVVLDRLDITPVHLPTCDNNSTLIVKIVPITHSCCR